jgi:hypothetical protein
MTQIIPSSQFQVPFLVVSISCMIECYFLLSCMRLACTMVQCSKILIQCIYLVSYLTSLILTMSLKILHQEMIEVGFLQSTKAYFYLR